MIKKSTLNSMFLISLALFFNVFRCCRNAWKSSHFCVKRTKFINKSKTIVQSFRKTFVEKRMAAKMKNFTPGYSGKIN